MTVDLYEYALHLRACMSKYISLYQKGEIQVKTSQGQGAIIYQNNSKFRTSGETTGPKVQHHLNFPLMKELISLLLLSIKSSFSVYPREGCWQITTKLINITCFLSNPEGTIEAKKSLVQRAPKI